MSQVAGAARGRPLLVTDDVELLDDLLRMAAAVQIDVDVAASTAAAASRWQSASAVLVGADVSGDMAAASLPRRADVVLVGNGSRPAGWSDAADIGASQVVGLPTAEPWLVDRLAQLAVAGIPEAAVVALMGARGGAGSSTFAAALAANGERLGLRVAAVDLDPDSCGIGHVLGAPATSGTSWEALVRARGRIQAPSLYAGLPRPSGIPVLGWGTRRREIPAGEVVAAVVDALRLATDLVVLDLPRCRLNSVGEARSRASRSVLLVPLDSASLRAASHLIEGAELATAAIEAVTRDPAPGGMTPADVRKALGVNVVAHMRSDPMLARDAELGLVPGLRRRGPLGRACRALLRDLPVPQRIA